MTIFLAVLKQLIKQQLNKAEGTLANQAATLGHNHQLSLEKKNILDELEKKIVVEFVSTGDDEADSKSIIGLIEKARSEIQGTQEKHQKSGGSGGTLDVLTDLIFHTNSFYTRIDAFNKPEADESEDLRHAPVKLRLINHPYQQTPEEIVYYHAVFYFGEEIFTPNANDQVIRKAKEEAVLQQIQILSERIRPEFAFESRKEIALSVLKSLAKANQSIIAPSKKSGFGLPALSLWGLFSVTVPILLNSGEGRFGQQFSLAETRIAKMEEVVAAINEEPELDEEPELSEASGLRQEGTEEKEDKDTREELDEEEEEEEDEEQQLRSQCG